MTTRQPYTSIAELYAEHRRGLLAFLTRQVHNPELAEDLCQDTFVKALRAWETRNPEASATAWLYQIARNTACDELRRRRRIAFLPMLDDELFSGSETVPEHRFSEQEPVRRALAKLPAMYRWPLVLHFLGYSVKEIGALLGCSPNAIKARLFRARGQFRRAYGSR